MMEWTEDKIIEFVNQGWTLSWDKTNQKYKLQKRINGKVKSYTLPKRFNEFCKRLKESDKYLEIFKDLSRYKPISDTLVVKYKVKKEEFEEILKKYIEYKLSNNELKDLLHEIFIRFAILEAKDRELKNRLDKASRMVRTGFGFNELTFQCPNCFEDSKLKYDDKLGKWVCSNCGKIPF